MDAKPAKPRMGRTSLQPLALDEALRKAMEYKPEPAPAHKPGAGRKKKPVG